MKGGFFIKKRILGVFLFASILTLNKTDALYAQNYIPGGENIAIEIKADGLLVTGTYDIQTSDGKVYNPSKDNDIQRGDLIYEVNHQKVESMADLPKVFEDVEKMQYSLPMKYYRDHISYTKTLQLIKTSANGSWKTGLLVKERILGIGTVTIYDPETNTYAALGHQFSDGDFSDILDLTSGNIYESEIIGIKKSTNGTPGEKIAEIDESEPIGDIDKNNQYGIYGQVDKIPKKEGLEVAKIEEVKLGDAEIWTVMNGSQVEKYKIKITNLKKQESIEPKGITFEIVDKELLKMSNGIVQGMSGSPIIQNDKIVGAVTHVLVDDVKKGYGLYIQWMLQEMK